MRHAHEPHELAACVGQFQLPSRSEVGRLRSALARARRLVVFLTWAHAAPSPAHPFDWEWRAARLRELLAPQERERVSFLPVRQHYDAQRTQRAMEQGMRQAVGAHQASVLWLLPSDLLPSRGDCPPEWQVEEHEAADDDATRRLHSLYEADDPAAALQALARDLEPGVTAAVRSWLGEPSYARLRDEWRQIARERKAWSVAPYPVVLVTVDAVVRAGGHVLLVRRGRAPGQGLWALPGGFLDPAESVLDACLRELVEETGLPLSRGQMRQALRGVKVFDHPQRSQRGRIVTHAHFFDLGDTSPPPVQGGDDAAAAKWVLIRELPAMESQLHDDHFHMLDEFLGLTGDP